MVFIDLEKAFDSVCQGDILELLIRRNVPLHYVRLLAEIYDRNCTGITLNGTPIGNMEL